MTDRARGTAARKEKQKHRLYQARTAALTVALGAVLSVQSQRAQSEPIPVDVQLVLAVDVSSSMSREELEIQRSGYVAAIKDPLL